MPYKKRDSPTLHQKNAKQGEIVNEKQKYEKIILKISLYAGMAFVVVELLMSLWSNSQAILMDAVFDAAELIVIGLSLFLTPLFYQPVSEKKPYGYSQFESVFIIVKGFMLISVTLGLITNNIQILLQGGRHLDYGQISAFEFILAFFSLLVLLFMRYFHKKTASPTVEAEIYGWKIDFLCSIGIALAFFAQIFLAETPAQKIAPYFDQIVAIVIALFMLPQPVKMISDAFRSIFLFAPKEDILDKVKDISHRILADFQYTGTFYDVVLTGRRMWISIYFKPKSDVVSMTLLHEMYDEIYTALGQEFDDYSLELVPELEEQTNL